MDLDAFFASCELLLDPSLKGKPVIVGGTGMRGVVTSCTYEARAFGVRSGMPFRQALRLCPQAITLPGHYRFYGEKSREVRQVVEALAPQFEFASIDEFYCDFTGMERFFGAEAYARMLRERIQQETNLPISMGIASSKTVAKVATNEAKPNGVCVVPPGQEAAFLARLHVSKLPGVGPTTEAALGRLGIHTVQHLQRANPQLLNQTLGKFGPWLWNKAHGRCEREVEPYFDRKSIGAEHTFRQRDSSETQYLLRELLALTEEVCYGLRQKQFSTGCVAVKLRYHDFETHTRQRNQPLTDDEQTILRTAQELFHELWDGHTPVRLIGVRLTQLETGAPTLQTELFDNRAQQLAQARNLAHSVDALRGKYGATVVGRAAAVAHR
jgi:DNA polymerase-4